MASLFRPPDQPRHNDRSPKLTLPANLRKNVTTPELTNNTPVKSNPLTQHQSTSLPKLTTPRPKPSGTTPRSPSGNTNPFSQSLPPLNVAAINNQIHNSNKKTPPNYKAPTLPKLQNLALPIKATTTNGDLKSLSESSSMNKTRSLSNPITNPSLSTSSIPRFAQSMGSSSTNNKRRPAPPPLPPLVLTSSGGASNNIHITHPNHPNLPKDAITLTESLQNLHIDTHGNRTTEKPSPSPYSNSSNSSSTIKSTFNKPKAHLHHRAGIQDTLTQEGEEEGEGVSDATSTSETSIVVSPYERELIDTYKLQPSSQDIQKLESRDVDQLDEDMWYYSHLSSQIVKLGLLGEGAGGSVAKCKLVHGKKIFALKTINILNTDPEYQKQILRELQFNRSFESEYIVKYYGMFADDQNTSIFIAMEYMGGGSLDAVYKHLLDRGGRMGEKVLGKIAESVLRGLSYLHEKKIIHRDIKPQNILLNNKGQVKLCDFGVSGEAVNSLATTFTGTSFYMAPERIQGQPYSVTCDVWSLGLTLLEVAEARFPFGDENMKSNLAPIDLLMVILTFTPKLKEEPENHITWSNSFRSFIDYCLKKEPRERPSPRQMIKHPWIQGQMKRTVNMEKFIKKCWEQ